MTCARCIHFAIGGGNPSYHQPSRDKFTDIGLCRRKPPVLIPPGDENPSHSWGFPVVHERQSCGDEQGALPIC